MALGMVGLSPSTATSSGLAARTSATVEFEVPKSSPQLADADAGMERMVLRLQHLETVLQAVQPQRRFLRPYIQR